MTLKPQMAQLDGACLKSLPSGLIRLSTSPDDGERQAREAGKSVNNYTK